MIFRKKIPALIVVVLILLGAWAYSLRLPYFANEDPYRIWIAVLKGFEGEVRYVGDRDGWAYFLIGDVFPSSVKMRTGETQLHEHFPLGSGKSFVPKRDEVLKGSVILDSAPL